MYAGDVARYYANRTASDDFMWQYLLHDFGSRGVSCREQSQIGGAMHLMTFWGSDNLDGIRYLMKHYDHENWAKRMTGGYELKRGHSVPACYDDVTEILTNSGWKLFKNLDKTDLVAQLNDDESVSFVKPLEYFNDEYIGPMYHFKKSKGYKYVDMCVTPNHRMIFKNKRNKKIKINTATDVLYNSHKQILIGGKYNKNEEKTLSAINKLKIAFQADGSYPSHEKDYAGNFIRFSFKKQRKIDRLIEILNKSNLQYTMNEKDNNGYVSFLINTEEKFNKTLSWVNIENMSYTECCDFINELQHWDGTLKNNTIIYCSTIKENIDVIQSICAISNHKTHYNEHIDKRDNRKISHTLSILKNKNTIDSTNVIKEKIMYDGIVYCVKVPSGMLITRRNNIINVSGNTEHLVMTLQGRDGEKDVYRRLLKLFSGNDLKNVILSIVSDTYNVYDVCRFLYDEPALREAIQTRTANTVIRPDSGEAFDVIPKMLDILSKNFGYTYNEKGYKVLNNNIKILQGDGIDLQTYFGLIQFLCDGEKWSVENFVFGSGGGLLQKFDRDTLKFAIKCSHARYEDGTEVEVYKDPITGGNKKSKKGKLWLFYIDGKHVTLTEEQMNARGLTVEDNLLIPVFDCGKVLVNYSIEEISDRMINELTMIENVYELEYKDTYIEQLEKEVTLEVKYYETLFNTGAEQKHLTASIVRKDAIIKEIERLESITV